MLPLAGVAAPLTTDTADAEPRDGAKALSRQADDKRPEDQLTMPLFGRPLTIGGEYEIEFDYREDLALGTSDDDLLRADQKLELEFLYEYSPRAVAFVEGKLKYRNDLIVEGAGSSREGSIERGETWIYWPALPAPGWALQVGRQNFREKREWWWDEDLDALRLHFDGPAFRAEAAVARELARVSSATPLDPAQEDVLRLIARTSWEWARRHKIEFFFLHQRDDSPTPVEDDVVAADREDETDADLTWIGARSLGRIKLGGDDRLHYWLDYGQVAGDAVEIDFDDFSAGQSIVDSVTGLDVRGWGLDIGTTLESSRVAYSPVSKDRAGYADMRRRWLTLGYAMGSGDANPADRTDRAYRQTGLQDNNGKFRGVDSFRYYGELLRPELSNIQVFTLSLGHALMRNSSVELVLHGYRQVKASTTIKTDRLRISPNGVDRSIGAEFDAVLGIEEWKHLELELVGGIFRAGEAFGDESGKLAGTVILKANYNF